MNTTWLHLISVAVLLSCAFVTCDFSGGPPEIEIIPQNQTVVGGKIAVFVCTATGGANVQMEWTRNNGRKIRNPSRSASSHLSQRYGDEYIPKYETIAMNNGLVLRIHALKQETFECVVGNGAEELMRATAQLNIVYENSKPPGFPHIARRSADFQWIGKGHHALIPCQVTGDPKPSIRWLKNKIPLNMEIPRYSLIEEQFLKISDVKEEDKGKYECMAENSFGSALSSKIGLYVSERRYKPHFTIKPEDLYAVLPGSSLNITCLANGSPLPSVKWMNDSTIISPNHDGLNVLELTDIQGAHNYTCVALSEMGNEEVTAQVVAQKYPVAPTNLKISDVNATCAHLSWSYGTGFENLRYFTVAYKADHRNYFSEVTEFYEPIRQFIIICELDPDTEYEFYVIAVNGVGKGPRSSSVFATPTRQ